MRNLTEAQKRVLLDFAQSNYTIRSQRPYYHGKTKASMNVLQREGYVEAPERYVRVLTRKGVAALAELLLPLVTNDLDRLQQLARMP